MIGIGLDLLLIALLVGALLYGVKLEKKLRYLRETQAGFAGAAAELNMAIARADGGLQEMKRTAAEAQLVLGDRLQDARALNARLEQRMTSADKAAAGLEEALERKTAAAERAVAGLDQRVAVAERASTGLDAMLRKAEAKLSELDVSSRVQSSPSGGSPAEGREGGERPLSRPPSPASRVLPPEGEDLAPRVGHLAMLRREAAAKREALARPEEDEELVLDAPVRVEALSRRPRMDDELFEPARAVGAGR